MNKITAIILAMFLAVPYALGATVQNLHDGFPLNWGGGGSIDIHGITLISKAGTISSMHISQSGTSGSGKTWAYTVYKNGSSTSMTCSISGTSATTCSDTTNTFTVAAGDYLHIRCTPTYSSNTVNVASNIKYTPDTAGDTIMFTKGPTQSNGPVNFGFNGQYTNGWQDLGESQVAIKIATAGTIDNLRVLLSAAMATGTSMSYTLYVNGATTALTCTTSAGATGCNDTSNSVSVSEGDKVSIYQSGLTGWPPSSPTRQISVNLNPTTDGEYLLNRGMVNSDTDLSTTNTEYLQVQGMTAASTTSTDRSQYALASTAKRMYISIPTAPGSGKSRAYTLRKNNADTSLTCTISDTATTCNAATDVSLSDGDLLNVKTVPTGTPAATEVGTISLAEYITPTGGGGARRRVMVIA